MAARRWRLYAGRALFVVCLLVALESAWVPSGYVARSYKDHAALSRSFMVAVTLVQLVSVMLAAPAVTAGAICVDKTRGTLQHVFVTDLTDREIVVGKLATRLVMVLSLTACSLPVLALVGLLGGTEPSAVVGAYVVTIGLAVVACAVALTFSVWVRKMHQALLATYLVLAAWSLLYPLVIAAGWAPPAPLEAWPVSVLRLHPIGAAVVPLSDRARIGLADQVGFALGALVLAGLLVGLAVQKLRPVALAQEGRPAIRSRPGLPARIVRLLPEPPLDANPVLWREWHRKRPSRWTGRFWMAYAIVSALLSVGVINVYYLNPAFYDAALAGWVNAVQVTIGLLLLSIAAATALAEERDRGTLDVVMATPLSTRTILWGKWWGTYALVPRLLILPTWVAAGMALVSGQWLAVALMIGTILASAAAITSLGLAVATWISRPGRAVAASVLGVAFMTFGWYYLVSLGFTPRWVSPWAFGGLLLGGPFLGVRATAEWAGQLRIDHFFFYGFATYSPWTPWMPGIFWRPMRGSDDPVWPLCWIVFDLALALALMGATQASFNRCLGRVSGWTMSA